MTSIEQAPIDAQCTTENTMFFLSQNKNLEIGVSTKLIITACIRGNVLLKNTFLHSRMEFTMRESV